MISYQVWYEKPELSAPSRQGQEGYTSEGVPAHIKRHAININKGMNKGVQRCFSG